MKTEIRPLEKTDDMAAVTDLIMDTDPYLYRDLFGSRENALKVLPRLFARGNSVFNRSVYFVAVLEKEIVGITALYKMGNEWNEADVRAAFVEAGVPLPESFSAASACFLRMHNYNPDISACNICVRADMRGKGIGGALVDFAVKAAGRSDIRLEVLADNEAALRLYYSRGFVKLYEFFDYGGYGMPNVKVLQLIRLYED